MTKKCLDGLIATIAEIKTDISWIKKIMYICAGSSLSAVLGMLFQLLLKK
jgi:hypothetical protein